MRKYIYWQSDFENLPIGLHKHESFSQLASLVFQSRRYSHLNYLKKMKGNCMQTMFAGRISKDTTLNEIIKIIIPASQAWRHYSARQKASVKWKCENTQCNHGGLLYLEKQSVSISADLRSARMLKADEYAARVFNVCRPSPNQLSSLKQSFNGFKS